MRYRVLQNGNDIGWLKLQKKDSTDFSLMTLSSEIKKRLIFLFKITENQEAYFEKGILIRSSAHREINNDTKINRKTVYTGNSYEVTTGEVSATFQFNNITYDQLSLYFFEPVNIKQVYSDNYGQYLKIEKNGNGYILELPDGNKTYYYYTNGICSKVRVVQSFFTVEFVLSK